MMNNAVIAELILGFFFLSKFWSQMNCLLSYFFCFFLWWDNVNRCRYTQPWHYSKHKKRTRERERRNRYQIFCKPTYDLKIVFRSVYSPLREKLICVRIIGSTDEQRYIFALHYYTSMRNKWQQNVIYFHFSFVFFFAPREILV